MSDPNRRRWFLLGLFLITLSTLALEILDTRLVSALTWYHLSFFAVSVAMFGMAAGAVRVYLGGEAFQGEQAPIQLRRWALILSVAIPVTHIMNLCVPLTVDPSLTAVAASVLATLLLAVPFFAAGVVVAIALTRVPGAIGTTYAIDLLGAALGSLLVVPLLEVSNLSSSVFIIGAVAAMGAWCFARMTGDSSRAHLLAVALVVAGIANGMSSKGFRVLYAKGNLVRTEGIAHEAWNIHSLVVANKPEDTKPHYWGKGEGAPTHKLSTVNMNIDGSAGTTMTRWEGDIASLDWVKYDVTSLPYHLRKGGDAAIIGVGGGRDVLTALWAESRSVTAIEINDVFVRLLNGPFRRFAGLADRPDVELVHDEARSYLTRTDKRFDVLQMSLIDTWAATGAGAFTLSENGLYTQEAWRVFLGALKPTGIFSVSRWFSPEKASETSRLLALGTSTLLEMGVEAPADHMVLVARKHVATLMVSPAPLTAQDRARLRGAVETFGFEILLAPGHQAADPSLQRIASSGSWAALNAAIDNEIFDFSPPTDERPYFFNMLRPTKLLQGMRASKGVMVRGNMLATATLLLLFGIAATLVGAVILGPLWRSGLPKMSRRAFTVAVLYFAAIGMGFMLVQIPFMQRFSVYLGHPTYAIAIILFSMILFTGIGSFLSDRIPVIEKPGWLVAYPLAIGATIVAITQSIQPLIDTTISSGLTTRGLIVVAVAAPVSLLLGLCFPIGMRLVERISPDATPWMWGVNGASGVLASVIAMAISMWAGIHVSLYVAALLYLSLLVAARMLWRLGNEG
jgi:hypothetical protein